MTCITYFSFHNFWKFIECHNTTYTYNIETMSSSDDVAQAKADVKAVVDDPPVNDEATSDDSDMETNFNYTQREHDKAIDIRNSERMYQLASGSKTSDNVRATAYIKAAVDAV